MRNRIRFQKEGQRGSSRTIAKRTKKDDRWNGSWKVAADLDSQVIFPVVTTTQRPDLTVRIPDNKHVIIMELTMPWEENIGEAFRSRFRLQSNKLRKMTKELQEAAERSSLFIWMKREDVFWLET